MAINQININNTVHDIGVKAENIDGIVENANTVNTIKHYDTQAYNDKSQGWGVENSFYDKNGTRVGFINNYYNGDDTVNMTIGADKGIVKIVNGECNPTPHIHDDRYYTESEIDSKINNINNSKVPFVREGDGFQCVTFSKRDGFNGTTLIGVIEEYLSLILKKFGPASFAGNIVAYPFVDGYICGNVWGTNDGTIMMASALITAMNDGRSYNYYKVSQGSAGVVEEILSQQDVVDNLQSTATNLPLSAKQGNVLNQEFINLRGSNATAHMEMNTRVGFLDSNITALQLNDTNMQSSIDGILYNALRSNGNSSKVNIDDCKQQGVYFVNNVPEGGEGVAIVFNPFHNNTTSASVQFFIPWNTGAYNSYVRIYYNNQWYSWRKITS